MRLKAAAGSIVAAIAAASAFAADPYPDQRGALPAAEVQAATAAMRAMPGADARMSLVASGRRAGTAYVVFATAAERPASILTLQRRILCTGAAAQWSCAPQVLYRFDQGTLKQTFAYSAKGVTEDPVMPFKIVAYFGQCASGQYEILIGSPLPGGMPAIAEVVQDGKRVTVTAGTGDTYELAETKPGAEQTCAFALQSARVARPAAAAGSVAAADPKAQESAPQEAAQAGAQPGAAAPASVGHPALRWVIDAVVLFNLIAVLAALVLPLAVRWRKGRRAAAMTSTLCTAAAIASAIAAIVVVRFAGAPGSARALTLVIPATLVAFITCVVWTVIGILAGRPRKPAPARRAAAAPAPAPSRPAG